MVEFWGELVKNGIKTIYQVPIKWRAEVEEWLNKELGL